MNFYMAISIGNTDNKLSQREWSNFVNSVNDMLNILSDVHFFGGSSNWTPWQNVAWIVQIRETSDIRVINRRLTEACGRYFQTSIFTLRGEANFITEKMESEREE